jgi:hypothetical protein
MRQPPDHRHRNLAALSDEELIAATRHWQAKRHERGSDDLRVVWQYEDEMTRRFGGVATVKLPLIGGESDAPRPWWKFW